MNRIRGFFFGALIFLIYRALSLTWKIKVYEPDSLIKLRKEKKPFILSHFHGDELALVCLTKRYKIATMTSTSKDGELMNTVLILLGGKTSRGSSTRGGVSALKGLIKLCKNGHSCSVAVDGPKGPIYKVKPGVFEIAKLSKSKIFAAGVYCNRFWSFPKAWNQTYLPKPFSKIIVNWSEFDTTDFEPIDPKSPHIAIQLEKLLFESKHKAKNLSA